MRKLMLASAGLLVLVGTAIAAPPPKSGSARAALLATDVEWSEAARTNDVERIVSFWTDDAVIYSPREAAVTGKAAIRGYVGESLKVPGFAISWKPSEAVVAASGDMGYTMGANTITAPDAQGRLTTTNGRYLTLWRKEPDGRWRCVVDFWNEAPPAASGR